MFTHIGTAVCSIDMKNTTTLGCGWTIFVKITVQQLSWD